MVVDKDKSINDIKKSVVKIEHTLQKQSMQLEHHIKRTDQMEHYIKQHDIKFNELTESMKSEIPILLDIIKDSNKNQTKTILKLLSFGGIALTSLIAIFEIILRIQQ